MTLPSRVIKEFLTHFPEMSAQDMMRFPPRKGRAKFAEADCYRRRVRCCCIMTLCAVTGCGNPTAFRMLFTHVQRRYDEKQAKSMVSDINRYDLLNEKDLNDVMKKVINKFSKQQ